jgi:hypothetical protein
MPIMTDKELAKGFLKGLEPMAATMLIAFIQERGKTASDEEMQHTYDTVICLSGAMSMKRSADALESIKKVVASYALMQALADPKNKPIIEEMQAKRDAMLGAGTTPTLEGPKNAS